jgi:hypothetical protein
MLIRDPRVSTPVVSLGSLSDLVSFQRTLQGAAQSLVSLTRAGAVATATTATAHQLETGDVVRIAGADQADYNVARASITVTGPTTFTYAVSGAPVTPATGTMTATYVDDGMGGGRAGWITYATGVPAAIVPWASSVTGVERLEAAQMRAMYDVEIWTHYREDVRMSDRVLDDRTGDTYQIRSRQLPGGVKGDLIGFLSQTVLD